MKSFLQKHAASRSLLGSTVIGILSGFDRLVFRGSLREICYAGGMRRYLSQAKVLLKGFGAEWHCRTFFCSPGAQSVRSNAAVLFQTAGRG